jgi:hypothetical protein
MLKREVAMTAVRPKEVMGLKCCMFAMFAL